MKLKPLCDRVVVKMVEGAPAANRNRRRTERRRIGRTT